MIKKLLRSVREYKKPSLLTPLFMMINVIFETVIPLLMADLIDNGIDAGDMGYILKMGGILVGMSAVSFFFDVMAGRTAAVASAGFAKNLRHDLFYRIQGFSFTNIDRFSSASLVTRLTTDVSNVQESYHMMIRIAVRCPLMLIFAVVMSFTINPKLAWIFLVCIPILGGGLWVIMTHAHPVFERVFHTYDKLNRVVQENLRGVRVVKSFVREEHETGKFKTISNSIYQDFSKAERLIAFNGPLMQLCVYSCMLAISWFGARLIVGGEMTTGQLMSMMSYTMMILISLMMISMVFVILTISRTSAERIVEVLDEESTLKNCDHPLIEVPDGSISFEDVSFRYSKDVDKGCLKHVSLRIASGETVGIIGGTGSAKSTLISLIPRLYDVNEGSVKVGGNDVRDYDLDTLRSAVAVVLQKNELFSGTIKENLRWGDPYATDEQLVHACKLAAADDFIRSFPEGYDTHVEQGGTNVSGGQKQRLCIARALLKKPKILILDDSTSAVDTATDAAIQRAFREEIPNTTKIVIAQRITSVQDADKIIVLENGCIDAIGTHEELLRSNTIYREVYDSQQKGGAEQ